MCNEPNIGLNNKSGSPDPAGYAADLVEAAKAIREADPQAIVLLGGLANVRSAGRNISDSDFLKAVYRFPEVRGAFDGVSLHPYEKTPEGVVRAVAEIRQILVDNGDGGKSLWITEFGWATAGPPDRLLVSRELQAVNLTRTMDAFKFLRASFNIRAACWYFWRDTEKPIGHAKTPRWDSYAGLFDKAGKPKPSWNAWLSVTGGRDSG